MEINIECWNKMEIIRRRNVPCHCYILAVDIITFPARKREG